MSSFVVSHEHINYLVNAGLAWPGEPPLTWADAEGSWPNDEQGRPLHRLDADTATAVGAMLWEENCRAVDYVHDEQLVFAFGRVLVDQVTALKLLQCYVYQNVSWPGWEDSEARRFCDRLRIVLIERLPGYSSAPWAI